MSERIKNGILLIAIGLISCAVTATELNIKGIVVASPCTVDSASVSQDVDFQQLRSTDLKQAGTATEWQPFSVKLTRCPASTSKSTVIFSGTPSTNDATLFANSGTAQNIDVQLVQYDDKSLVLSNGSSMTVEVDASHNAVYHLAGRLYTVTGSTIPGTFNSEVLMSFTYQ